MIRLAILLLRPLELYHEARIKRAYRRGKFARPAEPDSATAGGTSSPRKRPAEWSADQGKPCVTTRRKV